MNADTVQMETQPALAAHENVPQVAEFVPDVPVSHEDQR
jgi:hypothetical protein